MGALLRWEFIDLDAPVENNTLHDAVLGGNQDQVEALLREGVNPNEPNSAKNTSLHLAVNSGHFHLLKPLVSFGGCINAKGRFGNTPLHMLLDADNQMEGLDAILEFHPDLNLKNKSKDSILQHFVKWKPERLDMITRFLEVGSDPNTRDRLGNTCLHSLAMNGDFVGEEMECLVGVLLDHGAEAQAKNSRLETPIDIAAVNNISVARVLLLRIGEKDKSTSDS